MDDRSTFSYGNPMKKKVLSDHKKVGTKLIPPIKAKIPDLAEVSHVRMLLPELLWIAILMEVSGEQLGTRDALDVAKAAAGIQPRGHYGFATSYASLDRQLLSDAVRDLPRRTEISRALAPLIRAYPECPLAPLCLAEDLGNAATEAEIQALGDILKSLYDKYSRQSVMTITGAVYIDFCNDRLKVVRGTSSLERLPEIERYPDTEFSLQLAASIRAAVNGIAPLVLTDTTWPAYFWNRGKELSPCKVWESHG